MAGSEAAACRRVLVTGGTGFLGSAVAALCRQAGVPVRVGARGSSAGPFPDSVRLDVEDPATLAAALDGVDRVIHCAGLAHRRGSGIGPRRFFDVNAAGTARLVEASRAAGVTRFVLVSTVAVYGPGQGEIRNETSPCQPEGPYAESKFQAEREAVREAGSGMALAIVRLGTVYGEGGDPGNVARLIRALAAGRFLWVGDGANRKTLVHRGDAARACLLALERAPGGFSLYNAAADPMPLKTLVGVIAGALGRRVSRFQVPAGLARALAFGPLRGIVETWLRDDAYSSDRIRGDLGFVPEVALADGIRREVEWVSRTETRRRS